MPNKTKTNYRDTSTIPNILWFEYVTIRGEVNTRKKAISRKSS